MIFEMKKDVEYTQAYGCRLCLHIGSTAMFFGSKKGSYGTRIEILTPRHWFRWSKG